jgi:hypothetical protein
MLHSDRLSFAAQFRFSWISLISMVFALNSVLATDSWQLIGSKPRFEHSFLKVETPQP